MADMIFATNEVESEVWSAMESAVRENFLSLPSSDCLSRLELAASVMREQVNGFGEECLGAFQHCAPVHEPC